MQEPEDRRARTALFFRDLCVRTAHLVSAWQCVGFCHGLVKISFLLSYIGTSLCVLQWVSLCAGIVDIVEPQNKGHYGPTILSLVERLLYLKGRIMLVGLKYVYFVERSSLSRLVTYLRFHCTPLQSSVESFPISNVK